MRKVKLLSDSMVNEVAFDLPFSRKQIADYIGLTIETVSRQMSALKDSGIIEIVGQRHIIVKDLESLRGQAGDSC